MNHSQSSSRAVLIDDTPRLAWAFLAVMLAVGLLFFFGRIGEAAPAVGAEDSGAPLTTSQERDLLVAGLTSQVPAACRTDAIAYWKLDEISGTSYANSINASHTATCVSANCPTPAAGQVNGGQAFTSAQNMRVNVPTDTAFNWPTNGSFSISVWVKIPEGAGVCGSNAVFVGRHGGGTPTDAPRWWVGCDGVNNRARFSLRPNGATNSVSITASDTPLNNGLWNHIVAVRDGGTSRIYVNGAPKGSTTDAFLGSPGNYNSTNPVTIGYYDQGFYLNGTLDEVAIYGRALTAAEIQRQYQAGLINFGYDVDTWTVSSSGGLWTQSSIWYNGNVPGATDYAVVQGLVGGAAVVLPASNVTAACVDVMPDGVLVFDETNQLTVNGAFNNYGAIEQVKNVNTGGGTVEFFHITGSSGTVHRGVEITAGAQDLASVQVTIYDPGSTDTGACTTNATSPDYAQRCFEILAPPNISATLRLYAADPGELNGIEVGDLRPYRFFNGAWQSLPLVGSPTTGTTDGFAYAEAVTPGFSYFLLGGPNAPTAVTLQSFNVTANNNLAVMGLVAALAAILLTAGLLITRRQTAVRER